MSNDLLDDFLTESHEHLDNMEQDLLLLEVAKSEGEQAVSELLNRLFRAVHSIKGAAGFLELQKIVDLAHCMENIFGNLRDKKEVPEANCVDALLTSGDSLRALLHNIGNMDSIDTSKAIDSLVAYCTEAPKKEDQTPQLMQTHASCHFYELIFVEGTWQAVEEDLTGAADVAFSTPTSAYINSVLEPDLLEALVSSEVTIKVLSAAEFSATIHAKKKTATLPATKPPTEAVTVKPEISSKENLPAKNENRNNGAQATNSTVRIDLGLLEQLMSLAGELVLVRNRHTRWFSKGTKQDEIGREITQRLDTVTREIQTSVMKTRMQPLERVFSKLPRLVREVSRQLSKDIELDITGSDIEVDRAILESLGDPLTHLLRNSCDHGIESPQERKAAGKPARGMVKVTASHENGCILIEIADNGKGMDPDVIAAKAIENGLINEREAEGLDTHRKLELVMLPGFSTAAALSNISGRGVGMDVVKSSVEKLGGSIEIDSRKGLGSKFTLRLPLTLAIIQSLLVSQEGRRYVIPRMNLEEVLNLVGEEVTDHIKVINRQEVFEYHGSYLQLVRLSEIFANPAPLASEDREKIALNHLTKYEQMALKGETPLIDIAVVRVGDRKIGLVVDHALDMEEIVVKPVHPAHKDLGIFLGATVLGDGHVSLILDIEGIARHALDKVHYSGSKTKDKEETFAARSDEAQKMLVFECGLNERFAIGLSFIRRIYNIQKDQIEKIGKRLYARIHGKPLLIAQMNDALAVEPCEMLEEMYLVMPRFGNTGCGILVSKICGIHEIKAEFNETPTGNSALMGSSIIDGMTTLFPDIYQICEAAEHLANNSPTFAQLPGNSTSHSSTETPSVSAHGPFWNAHVNNKSFAKKRILLAEDAPFFRQLISTYLRREDIHVDTAPNGAEALKMLDNNTYDLLLSDVEMPVMDGRELVRRVKSDNTGQKMPVIALTSLDNDDDRTECLGAGFDEYMIKMNREELMKTLTKYL